MRPCVASWSALLWYASNDIAGFTYSRRISTKPSRAQRFVRKGKCQRNLFHFPMPLHHSLQSSKEEDGALRLKFNIMKLIRTDEDSRRQELKMQILAALVKECHCYAESGEGISAKSDNEIDLPEQLTLLRQFIQTSPHAPSHRGNFRVFANADAAESTLTSLPSNILFSMDRPFASLRDSLSFQSSETRRKKGGMMHDNSEAVLWCGTGSNEHELEYASKVLDDMPFAQLYMGAALSDHGKILLNLDLHVIENLESIGLLLMDGETRGHGSVTCILNLDDLDVIEAVLLYNDGNITNVEARVEVQEEQQTLVKMIDIAVESIRKDPLNKGNEPQLVLLANSIHAMSVAAAISSWKRHQLEHKGRSIRRVENLLNQALVVVTFGNICQSFCSGPAYIHLYMIDDPWTSALGSTAATSSRRATGGDSAQDAVYFHAVSPYQYDRWSANSTCSHNAHNLNACLTQFLALIMRINGIQSFRALYEAARFVDPTTVMDINPKHFALNYGNQGDLIMPPRLDDELLPAMIHATGGEKWLWKDGIFESFLPDEIEATSHLEESFGYSAYEEIYMTCSKV
ncbi:hypothetical protein ACHAWF_006120 [Thalassiosira exigua]